MDEKGEVPRRNPTPAHCPNTKRLLGLSKDIVRNRKITRKGEITVHLEKSLFKGEFLVLGSFEFRGMVANVIKVELKASNVVSFSL